MYSTRKIFIPFKTLYLSMLPWLEEMEEKDCNDSIRLRLYNEDEDGSNLMVTGLKKEVDPFVEHLLITIIRFELDYEYIYSVSSDDA